MVSTRLIRSGFTAVLLVLGVVSAAQAAPVTLSVVSAREEARWPDPANPVGILKNAPIADFKYIINIDNTGTTEQRDPNDPLHPGCSPDYVAPPGTPEYPDSCHWTSIAGAAGSSPIYTQGDQADFAGAGLDIAPGRYLISVLADGFKLDGRHFTVNADGSTTWAGSGAPNTVELQPWPLPTAQIQAAVFEDISPVNSAPDLPAEHGLAGFQGHITDYLGEVTTDVDGNPLCGTGRCLSACYVVRNGKDVGTVAPVDAAGRCPTPVVNDATGLVDPAINFTNTVTNLPDTVLVTDAVEGKVKIPNLGPNRYALSVTPPDGSGWIQTTTLEGNHDWDAWVMENATGLDTEFTVAGEPFPAIIFGYVPSPNPADSSHAGSGIPANSAALGGTGVIEGVVDAVKIYVPTTGGVPGLPGQIWGGLQGAKLDKPIEYPWITLTNLGNGDTIVWAGKGDINGHFSIPGVPAGNYTLTWWDEPQNQILDLVNVTIAEGEHVDMGVLPLSGWWTVFDGYVYNDTNRNGVKDAGEPGLSGYTLTMRKRENSLMDRGTTVATTEPDGYYKFEAAYPMTQWLVLEAYDDLHYTTGVTYQADNQPSPTTILGAGVDVSVHPIIGLSGRVDWGKHTYDATGRNGVDPRNGGIVGTVSYDTTRNELDPRYAALEDWQPSISNLVVELYKPIAATPGCIRQNGSNSATATCDPTGRYALNRTGVVGDGVFGSIAHGPLLNTYLTETWQRPVGCVVRGLDGTPVVHGVDEKVLPLNDPSTNADPTTWKGCIEAPLTAVQVAAYETDQGTAAANFGATVDGNYGFGDYCASGFVDATDPSAPLCFADAAHTVAADFTTMPAGDWLVRVNVPNDVKGKPLFKVTTEDDINIGNGDAWVAPAVPPSACAGSLHTVHVTNPTFVDIGGSPYEGLDKPLCDTKLVSLANGKSIAPGFNFYTDVPLPGRHWFIIIDDLNFSSNQRSITYGEKAGMPFVPVGIYDYTDRLVTTVESDYNGLADVLLPSTNRINCPTPSGVCANLYRYVGNDPGVPGRLNTNYNPTYRTIAAEFEVIPGLLVPADLAPTQVGVNVQLPGGQTTSPVSCKLDVSAPELYAVSTPYAIRPANGSVSITINGKGFGASQTVQGALSDSSVTLGGVALGITSWTDTAIVANVTATTAYGPQQLLVNRVTAGVNGAADTMQSTVNGLTFHVIAGGNGNANYNPAVFEVGPGRTYQPAETLPDAANHAIQDALDAAAAFVAQSDANSARGALVVVYPNTPTVSNPRQNPRGAYYENLIINSRVKLQGVGPGNPDGTAYFANGGSGSIIDGGAFAGDSPVATDWVAKIGTMNWAGNQTVFDGAVVSLFMPSNGRGASTSANINAVPSIDGFDLRGGNQAGFPGNINPIGGGPTGQPGGLITQGGAVYANDYARNLRISNNVVQNNGGAYGTIRIGNPDQPAGANVNTGVVIANNRVIANGGTNLAGGIGLFAESDNYEVRNNDICGNFSAEYGGGISHLGLSPGGRIHDNRIYNNQSYDEGGGIMIAGALPNNPAVLSDGAGAVDIYNNLIQSNLANDDGGGLRFLMAGTAPMNVYNNFIVNNISTHEGGGIGLNDATNVRVFSNTIMKNQTTATAVTSNGQAAPAGLSTSMNSALLQATLPVGSPTFSDPLLFNNIFWDNRAGTRNGSTVNGLGAGGPGDIVNWDLGMADGAFPLTPTNSILQVATGTTPSPTNSAADPQVTSTIDVPVTFNAWRNNPAFLGAIMISADLPVTQMGNYHLLATSPAINLGAANKGAVNAPTFDIDNQARPQSGGQDAGGDEYFVPAVANLGIAVTDNQTSVNAGSTLTYTITVTNAGPAAVTGATVLDNFPGSLSGISWTCAATGTGNSCGAGGASGANNINRSINLGNAGGSVVYTVNATLSVTATGTLDNTATVTAPAGVTDPTPGNNTATDSDTIVAVPAVPTLTLRDNFNRGNANNLGANWSQANTGTNVDLRVFLNNAVANQTNDGGQAIWNASTFGAGQGAAMNLTGLSNALRSNSALILKANGGSTTNPTNYIRVRYLTGGGPDRVVVETTTNSGGAFTQRATFNTTFNLNDVLTAVASATGKVYVWRNATYLGVIQLPTTGGNSWTTGTGRVGIKLLSGGSSVDNFSADTVLTPAVVAAPGAAAAPAATPVTPRNRTRPVMDSNRRL